MSKKCSDIHASVAFLENAADGKVEGIVHMAKFFQELSANFWKKMYPHHKA